uniref:Uncharacterized protein n=1 Tax=Arundo donax TaxID=35708 RepID=A0A0A9A9W5_ARUDO
MPDSTQSTLLRRHHQASTPNSAAARLLFLGVVHSAPTGFRTWQKVSA